VANLRGVGRLVDISSKALSFRTETVLPLGIRLQISIPWPASLANGCPLKLFLSGRVIRQRSEVLVASIDQHEFRTLGNSAPPAGSRQNPAAFTLPHRVAADAPYSRVRRRSKKSDRPTPDGRRGS
jgi:hypothetical protein